jgi:hypothetical protein
MIPLLLAQLGLPLLLRAAGAGLEKIDNPVAAGAAQALKAVDAAVSDGTIPSESIAEANRHVEKMAELDSAEARITLEQVNRSLRAEVASEDAYVRRMRPTFGYIMALTWCAQMGAIAWVIVADPVQANQIINAMASLGTVWTVGLSVLGIYVYKRSEDKRAAAR